MSKGQGRSVVVTGMGVICAAGIGAVRLGRVLQAGRVCAVPSGSSLPVRDVAAVVDPVPEVAGFADDRKAVLALAALQGALEDAGSPDLSGERSGVFLGTGLSSVTPHELAEDIYPHLQDGRFDRTAMAQDLRRDGVAPRRHLPARVTAAVADAIGATGATGTSFSACAAASQAMAAGMRAVRRGQVDRVVVGGHDSMIHPMGLLSFVVLGALAPVTCRPFDCRRAGFLIGEGAALFVLEAEELARARGARIRARFLGAGTSVDGWNVTAPHPEGAGAERAMRRALRDAGCPSEVVGYINAHGTGTPVGDVAEARAIRRTFGERVLVSSIKGAIGHTIAAAGAIEAAATIAALQGGWLPGTAGLEQPDPDCPINLLRESQSRRVSVALSNSFGFGGQNSSLVFGSADA